MSSGHGTATWREIRVLWVALGATAFPCGGRAQVELPSAVGDPIVADGRLAASEWGNAHAIDLAPGTLLVQERDGFLELALRTRPLFVASICVQSGDEISILHASSAVGRAVYARGSGGWDLTQGFEWRLRGSSGAPASRSEQDGHLGAEGWVANTVTAGSPGETEFRISLERFASQGLRIAVGLMLEGDGSDLRGWPVPAESDGCTLRSTIAGPPGEREEFRLEAWTELRPGRYRL